jgi:GTPase
MPRRRGKDGEQTPFEARSVSADDSSLPVLSLIGRPNVGKSSLFNRLVGGRPALVEDRPGVTRDRRYGAVEWMGARFRVVDTGGLDPSADGILGAMRGQTMRAVDEADVIVFVTDAKEGLTSMDKDVARLLRRSGKPVLVAANKVDGASRAAAGAEAWNLGFGQVFSVSATHGRGVGDLLDAAVEHFAERARTSVAERRQVVAGEPPARRGAGAGPRRTGNHARSDRHTLSRR